MTSAWRTRGTRSSSRSRAIRTAYRRVRPVRRGFPRPRNTSRSRLTPSPPFARDFRARKQVLQHHFPGRALRRDVAELTELPPETELLAAGFPCPVRPNRRVFSELSERRENRARSRKRRRKRNAHTNTRPLYLYTPAIRMSPRSTSGVPVCVTARKPASARTCSAFCARRVRWCLGCCWRTSPAF